MSNNNPATCGVDWLARSMTAARPRKSIRIALAILMVAGSFVKASAAAQSGTHVLSGSGTVIDPGEPSCIESSRLCSVAIAGTLQGADIGHGDFAVRLSILWSSTTGNGILGRECAPASGILTFSAADRSTVTLSQSGRVCRFLADLVPSLMRFDGGFVVVGGTTGLQGVQGTGEVSLSVNQDGRSIIRMEGRFQ